MKSGPLTFVDFFGASGDLTARKLIPSLYRLARKQRFRRTTGHRRRRPASPFSDDAFRDQDGRRR